MFTRSGKIKYHNLKILLYYVTSEKNISSSLIPKERHKNNIATKWDTRGGVFKTQL